MNLLSEHISTGGNSKVLILFGGNPVRRDEIIKNLRRIQNLSIIGALSEKEGLEIISSYPKIDLVLIGGRYDLDSRKRIISYIKINLPDVQVLQPGLDFEYNEELIFEKIKELV